MSILPLLLAYIIAFIYAIVTIIIVDKTVFGEDNKKFAYSLHMVCFIVFCLLMILTFSNMTMIDRHNQNQNQYTMKLLNE